MRLAIFSVLLGLACSAPVPLIGRQGTHAKTDEGLLLLVPTLPVDNGLNGLADGQPQKREIEYEAVIIPGEVLRREIRQIAGLYSAPNSAPAPAPAPIIDSGIIITPSAIGGSAALSSGLYSAPAPAPAPAAPPAKPAFGGDAVLGAAGNILETTGNNLNSIGAATATNAGNAIQFISEVGQGTGAAAAEVAGSGLAYAGQLSGALLRALLQVPAIKARVVTQLIRGSEPLTKAVSDVIADSSDDLAYHFETKGQIIGEAVNIILRLIQDTLALKGRVIAAIGGTGLDTGAGIINAGVRIGGALFETGTNAVNAIGGGVKDVIDLGKVSNFPPPPTFPKLNFPQLPSLVIPQIDFPELDFKDLNFKNKNKQFPNKQFPNKQFTNNQLPDIHLPPIHLPLEQHNTVYSPPSSQSFITPAQPENQFVVPSGTYIGPY